MLTGATGGTRFGDDKSFRSADVRAELAAEAPFALFDAEPERAAAVPVLEPAGATRDGGAVRTGIGGGDGCGGDDSDEPPLDPEPDEPELEDPELEDPLDPEDPDPRGTA